MYDDEKYSRSVFRCWHKSSKGHDIIKIGPLLFSPHPLTLGREVILSLVLFYFFILTGLSASLLYALFIATQESFITAKKSLDFLIRIVDKRILYQHACQLNRWQCCVTHILTSRLIFTSRLDSQTTNKKICPNLAVSQVLASL